MEIGDPGSLKSDINVTPLVDVMLVMLIIFMLVTPLLQKGVGVSLPRARNVEAVPENDELVVIVTMRQNGDLFLGSDPVDRAKVVSQLRQRLRTNPALQLQIKADQNVRFGQIKRLVRLAREAGFDGASLITEEIREENVGPAGADTDVRERGGI